MALESVSAAETLIQSHTDNDNDDLEDGEIPSDEDDEMDMPIPTPKPPPVEPSRPSKAKSESLKSKNFDSKFSKSRKQSGQSASSNDRSNKYKGPSEDWAGDVEKAIKAALDKDKSKHQESNSKSSKSNRSKNRKRSRDDKEEDRIKDQKRRKASEEENGNEDDDEMLFVRGASPVRKGSHENSSPRRNNDHENYDSGSDYEDRPSVNRHRENENKRGGRGGRRGGKNERGGKSKGRNQTRNERNGRRNQTNNDHGQDPDAICVYYMQGKCHRGDDCPFSHNALPPRKMELCKFYLMDCCAKRDKCLYMHHDFPCKFFHTGLKCSQGENCKFSHEPLNEQVKSILLKHLETAPKEILGNFPRLSRDGALTMINNTEKNISQGQEGNQKIPSLFELNIGSDEKDECAAVAFEDSTNGKQKISSTTKERKPFGKKTRWGSDEDRVPYEQIMLLQSANQLGLQLPNAALDLAVQEQLQQQIMLPQKPLTMDFYNEANLNDMNTMKNNEDFTKDVEEDEILAQAKEKNALNDAPKDLDLRQMLTVSREPPRVVSIADEIANLTQSKMDEDSDQEEESDLVIEMPVEEEEPEKEKDFSNSEDSQIIPEPSSVIEKPPYPNSQLQDIPPNLPKKAQELFMRIQQQQREAQDSFKNLDDENNQADATPQEDWYSDDDADETNSLTIDVRTDDDQQLETVKVKIEPRSPPPLNIPQPAPFVDKLGDLSKIDISAEVSKLLSSLKAKSNPKVLAQTNSVMNESEQVKVKHEQNSPIDSKDNILDSIKIENEDFSPKSSPRTHAQASSSTRDPRMLRDPRESRESRDSRDFRDPRDPRQRRDEQKSVAAIKTEVKDPRSHKLETSIYSSGITAMDTPMDTDLRARADQDHRRKDMDLRQRFTDFGDTDLRFVGGNFTNPSGKTDVDLRQMLTLPFKPVPSHVPCTEIDGSIASHPPISYKVCVVDIPRPDYTGLKLTRNDPQVKYDPRLRKIFRITLTDIADSPMSPPPVKLETPKSPPQIRVDPRRKALDTQGGPSSQGMNTSVPLQGPPEMNMNMGQYMPGPPVMQGMPMMMGPNPMMGNMGPMMGGPMPQNMQMMGPNMGPSMGQNMGPNMGQNMGPNMGQNMGSSMGPNMGSSMGQNMNSSMGQNMGQNQMNFDPRYNAQRNNGAGLLGPGPMGFGPDVGPNFEGGYPNGNFNNFGPGPGDHRNFGPNPDGPNFGNGGDWNGNQNQNQNRRGGRIRRRNRNKNGPPMHNRSPT